MDTMDVIRKDARDNARAACESLRRLTYFLDYVGHPDNRLPYHTGLCQVSHACHDFLQSLTRRRKGID